MWLFNRDSPDDSQTGGDFYEYPVFCQGGFAARTTAATTGSLDDEERDFGERNKRLQALRLVLNPTLDQDRFGSVADGP
jgi:hypothetical protein